MQADINGNAVFYTTLGQGRPMLFVHGGPGLDHTYFRPWLDPLSDQFQLIYYDQLGQGCSTRPASYVEIGIDTWADEIDALRAFLGHDRMILFGHSFGSFIAQKYALRHGNHLDGLILCATTPVLDYQDVTMMNAQMRGTAEQVQAVVKLFTEPVADDAAFRQLWMKILPLYFHPYDPRVGTAMDITTRYSAEAFNQAARNCVPTFNTLSRLSEIAAPTLILAGRHDWIMPPTQGAARIKAAVPRSKEEIDENSGHFPFIEEADPFVATVKDWIASLS